MTTPVWTAGTLYSPGALVQPASAIAPVSAPVVNGGFESGDSAWTKDAGWTIGQFGAGTHFQGTWSAQWDLTGTGRIRATAAFDVVPGQSITASAQVQQGASSANQAGGRVEIGWYTAADALISYSSGNMIQNGSNQHWQQSSVTAVAPATAAKARIVGYAFRTSGGDELWMDNFQWNLQITQIPAGLVFKATQALAGYSASTEPVWPVIVGGTVVDNEVTWEGVYASRVVWEASPILVSGSSEPAFPNLANATVPDNTILWTAMSAQVTQAPNSKIIAIAASKIFAGDDDIIKFSATVNPLDWTTRGDAGYIPFGLNTYGGTPISALGLYRSNLVAFNSQGFQMWQVDQDPANMAILDAVPIPCEYHETVQPLANDLSFLTSRGVRSMGIAGASTNLQAGFFGKAIDPLILQRIKLGLLPFALFYPGAGQYWLIFGAEAFVLTMNGATMKDASWSRYLFPVVIDAWAIKGADLYLRATVDGEDVVWQVSADALDDDTVCAPQFDTALSSSSVNGSGFTAPAAWAFGSSDFTCEFWFKDTGGVDNEQYRVLRSRSSGGAQSGWEVQVRTDTMRLLLRPSSTSFTFDSATLSVDLTEWNHFAFVVDRTANTVEFFVNADSIGTASTATAVGAVGFSGAKSIMQSIAGACDELRVWTDKRTAQEISDWCQYPYQDIDDTTGCISAFQFNQDAEPEDEFIDTVQGTLFTPVSGATFIDGPISSGTGGACVGTPFEGYIAWQYLDFGIIGVDKTLESIEMAVNGTLSISIGWDQRKGQEALATPAYTVDGDTINGTPVPIAITAPSMQLRVTFAASQSWEWFSTVVNLV